MTDRLAELATICFKSACQLEKSVDKKLYEIVIDNYRFAENELFLELSVRFQLLARHKIKSYCKSYRETKMYAEDIAQNAIADILSKYKNHVFEVSFNAWSYTILKNKIFDSIRDILKREGKQKVVTVKEVRKKQVKQGKTISTEQKLFDSIKEIFADKFGKLLGSLGNANKSETEAVDKSYNIEDCVVIALKKLEIKCQHFFYYKLIGYSNEKIVEIMDLKSLSNLYATSNRCRNKFVDNLYIEGLNEELY
ncbi:MAG: sigma factor [Bacteroidota bacterium]